MNSDEWRQIVDLKDEGMTITGIAEHLHVSRNTIRRALQFDSPPADHRPRSGSSADSLLPQIETLLREQPDMTVAQLHRTLQWHGSRNTLAKVVKRVRSRSTQVEEENAAKSKPTIASNIPRYSTSFVGRKSDLASLRSALGRSRLVTITGSGGIGKTRLAAEASVGFRRAFADGVRFVELASLRSDTLVPLSILDALGFDGSNAADHSALDTLVDLLKDKDLLIVLDNCEHLIEACAATITSVIRGSTRVCFLVTSRESLSLPEEFVHVLEPLSTTDEGRPGQPGSAIELFETRAAAAGFALEATNADVVRRVCAQLDGMPLAIELACARLTVLSVEDLADRLDDRLALLTVGNRGGPDRHRSLHATVEWSYDLCTPQEQTLWARLSVFAEGFDLAMAEQVTAGEPVDGSDNLELLSGLVSKSVLHRGVEHGRVRFRMLETIRRFGAGKLSPPEAKSLRLAHFDWCVELVDYARRSWTGAQQENASDRLRANRANLRFALQHALATPNYEVRSSAARMVSTWFLWSSAFSVREHRLWVTEFLAVDDGASVHHAPLLATLGVIQTMQGERGEAARTLDMAEEAARTQGDDATLAFVLQTRGLNTYLGGNFEDGERSLAAALALYEETSNGTDLMWTAHVEMGMLLSSRGDVAGAAKHFEFVKAEAATTGEKWMLSYGVYGSGLVALVSGDFSEAVRLALDSLELKRAFDDTVGATLVTDLLAWAEAAIGSGQRAAVLLGAASSMWDSFGRQLYGSQHWVERRRIYEARARETLGNTAYEAAYKLGAAMSMKQLIAFAMNDDASESGSIETKRSATLSPREYDIGIHVAQGLTNREIAVRMVLSVRTIDGHVSNLLRKLGVTRRHHVTKDLLDS